MNIEEFRELNAPYKELKAFYEDLPYHKTQAMRNGALKKTMDILNSEKMTNQNLIV